MHGYAIATWLEERSDGTLGVDDSALYQALQRMEGRGWLSAEWGMSENNRRARYYKLTAAGRQRLRAESETWLALHEVGDGHSRARRADAHERRHAGYRRACFDLRLGGRRARRRRDGRGDRERISRCASPISCARGMSPDDARDEAMRRFGDFDTARRRLHAGARQRERLDAPARRWLDSVADAIRYALRQVRRAPGFTPLAVATLALGIGATTAMFTLVERVLLRPLPFPHAEQLVSLAGLDSAHDDVPTVSSADWQDWMASQRTLPALAIALRPVPRSGCRRRGRRRSARSR